MNQQLHNYNALSSMETFLSFSEENNLACIMQSVSDVQLHTLSFLFQDHIIFTLWVGYIETGKYIYSYCQASDKIRCIRQLVSVLP